jgi:hypothetical protein
MRSVLSSLVFAAFAAYTLLSPADFILSAFQQQQQQRPAKPENLFLPLAEKSVRFAVIGDSGTGGRAQYEVASQMLKYHQLFPYEFVLMMGDNIYGSDDASSMKRKFETPYKPLLDKGVKFYASLGNHDNPNQRFYEHFNMGGKRYFKFTKGSVDFFALDSTYMTPEQLNWIEKEVTSSNAKWKVAFFHHPLYSNARRHGPDMDLRTRLEPIFVRAGMNVVLSGHEHVYERLKPQKGIYYWIIGNSAKLRAGNVRKSQETAVALDRVYTFAMFEIAGDELHFQTMSNTGAVLDKGVFERQEKPEKSQPTAWLRRLPVSDPGIGGTTVERIGALR